MRKLLLFILFLSIFTNVYSFDMNKYLASKTFESNENFIKNFPYSQYLNSVEFTDFRTLQKHRYLIYKERDQNDNIGDRFIYQLAEKFIKLYPVTINQINTKIVIGESFLANKPYFNSGVNEIYKITGYYLLGQVARKIENEIKNKNFDLTNQYNINILKRLENNNVNVSRNESSLTKLKKNAKKGNYDYIFDRIWLKVKEYYYPITIKLPFSDNTILISFFVILILLFIANKVTRIVSIIIFVILTVSPLFIKYEKPTNINTVSYNKKSNFTLSIDKKLYPIKKGKDHLVQIYNLKAKNGNNIGQAIWMKRPNIKAKYFATKNVYNKYANLKNNSQIVLATAGGFTNTKGQPLGLTVDNGEIVNAVLRHDRDGLIMVNRNGGIRILNLKRNKFILPGNKSIEINNPLNSLISYSDLINWATKYKATIFQVQLLAYSNKILIDPAKAPNQLRERRILALFSDKKTGEVHHAIFNIEASYNLALITDEIFAIIASRNKKVEAILNLDVGSYNILNVFDEKERLLNNVKGPVDIKTATNLLIYSK